MELSLHSCSVEGYGVAKLSVSGEPNQEPGPAFLEGEAKSACLPLLAIWTKGQGMSHYLHSFNSFLDFDFALVWI